MKKFIFTILFLFFVSIASADNAIQRVEIAPLTGGVSFNTVTTSSVCGWVTASSVVISRKEIMILNTSTTENAYLTGVSGSSVKGTLYPRESATFKAASSLNIFVSSNSVTPIEIQVWEIR